MQQAAALLPWFHNCVLLDKLKTNVDRAWYANAAITHGWSRSVLVHQIETRLMSRSGRAQNNFARTLPKPQSDLASQLVKDPYTFDFLSLGPEAQERDLERGLVSNLSQFLVELGVGFAFVGSQYPIEVDGREFRIDLLFYHLKLRCFIVFDLKARGFEPEDAGKMNFYLSAVDDLLRNEHDQPTMGIILCKTKSKFMVEYALRDLTKPLGVSNYKLVGSLPKSLKGSLPTVAELEAEFGR